ncbi:helix-turn-helix transcriptional regulator [Haliangium ochraceum]|uniref:Transcriptional regulator, LuxR family n=1 Tax=Haliangium ochraceum (strain DSM 14365 / JCM 11303 / SMP-2) TaxID=502025 RepID=D0LTK0_HALO1|nr:response regulator transcription factor [Haliangium ochraceum]ACY13895.1 transcriptional regulator, LuxR family [Haliangium ochraceum DSM 14365]
MSESDFTSERRILTLSLVAFTLMGCLAAVDLVSDFREGSTVFHVGMEGAILLVGLLGAALVARKLSQITRLARLAAAEARELAGELAKSAAEAERWRDEARDLMRGLGQAIDEQFERWQLSPAEKEVGLLLLKGLSHREVAEARSVTEATARQQARAVYKKAGLSGRHELAAFFLEDLMLPADADGSA